MTSWEVIYWDAYVLVFKLFGLDVPDCLDRTVGVSDCYDRATLLAWPGDTGQRFPWPQQTILNGGPSLGVSSNGQEGCDTA